MQKEIERRKKKKKKIGILILNKWDKLVKLLS